MTPPALVPPSLAPSAELSPAKHHRSKSRDDEDGYPARAGLAPPARLMKDARSLSNVNIFGPRTASIANSVAPGSFSPSLRSATPRGATRPDMSPHTSSNDIRIDDMPSERRQAEYMELINKETKIKIGSENLLEALLAKNSKQTRDQRLRVESELSSSNRKIAELKSQLQEEMDRAKRMASPAQGPLSSLLPTGRSRSGSYLTMSTEISQDDGTSDTAESPTYALAEILQALEVEGMAAEFYVTRANGLVSLLKRYPTLKYDLAWSIFGLRMQTMLLSSSREVVAAGYRVTRHAIADRKSLQTIRALHTDPLVVVSLAKDSKATIEREQALKLVRAFLDVNDGVNELSGAVIRAVVAVAEHHEDRLRNIAIMTLTEIMVRNPELLARAGGVTTLSETFREGGYPGSETLATAFLHLIDAPRLRHLLYSGTELAGPFAVFTDPMTPHYNEDKVRSNARAVSVVINSWPGLFALSQSGFSSLSSLLAALSHPSPFLRNLVLDLLFELLHIKPPSWTSTFLAGRRLTTYRRVPNFHLEGLDQQSRLESEDDLNRANLVEHYTALILFILVRCRLVETLSSVCGRAEDPTLNRKTALLLGEVLKLAETSLPRKLSNRLQTIPAEIAAAATPASDDEEDIASSIAFQLDSVNRTLQRNAPGAAIDGIGTKSQSGTSTYAKALSSGKQKASPDMDDTQFRSLIIETKVTNTPNYLQWKWDLINEVIDGPLQNGRRVEEMIKGTKFLKRLTGFYRPFKYRFSDARSTKPNQRYVRTGAALVKVLLKTPEGCQFLSENKFLRQLAECLAQLDPVSGITSSAPMFARDRVAETLTGGYFTILGALGSDVTGLTMLARWRMLNMFYHVVDLHEREDLVQLLLAGMDFSLESHLRVLLSKALTASPKSIRIFATRLLRKYATEVPATGSVDASDNPAYWAIRLLVTQLYDPEVEVSEVAVQILQEACNRKRYLEYVVKCQPALDHLGEIGAPLLLRFLSTSTGYQYLHGLDYITQEMDDWFLGRNEKYVTLVEASLSRAFAFTSDPPKSFSGDDSNDRNLDGVVPPHFYRELTRTKEGCRLLQDSGHFEEFVSTIRDSWAEDDDAEVMLKVKGCLWAVGNVGSMDLGAPFLENTNVIHYILRIVEESTMLTMRGTAFFVLGLISRSLHGMELLAERGWDAAINDRGESLGYVLPPSLDVLFSQKVKTRPPPPLPLASMKNAPPPLNDQDALESRLYRAVVESGNPVLTRRALTDMNAVKARRPELFHQVVVFQRVLFILECHTIRLPLRQRIIDLFDKDVMRRIVLEEGSDDESESQPQTARPPLTARVSNPPVRDRLR